jgi:TetR/AcrR family transcriptional regulator, transcriptional repressor for nem operon
MCFSYADGGVVITYRLTCFVNTKRRNALLELQPMNKPSSSRRRRTNNPLQMRERILDSAYACFVAQGYHISSTQDILAAAQITAGALHHHFASKKMLGLAVINERVAQAVRNTWITPLENAQSAISGTLTAIKSISKELKSNGAVRGCPLNNLAMELSFIDNEFRHAAQNIYSGWIAALTTRIRIDQKSGWRRDLDPVACANFIIAAYSGAMAMAKAQQSERPLVQVTKMLETLLS